MSLLVIGTVAFDSIESPYGKADRVVGGSGTYISWSASYFYKPIFLQSIVGEDFPVEEITALQNRGVKTQGLDIIKGKKSLTLTKMEILYLSITIRIIRDILLVRQISRQYECT